MRLLLVHPSALMYSEIFLRLEPLGLERVAAAALADGHQVRVIDLQVTSTQSLDRELSDFVPDALGISLDYLANVPEAIGIAQHARRIVPDCFVFSGGHSVSFIAPHVLEQYFIGELDPCASIKFTRGCPWDCSFCSAWTFYGRSYRKVAGNGRRGTGHHRRTQHVHRRRRGIHPARAW
jgi:radical SAM superfamily enzyme YgiQ (UPF0313 family)